MIAELVDSSSSLVSAECMRGSHHIVKCLWRHDRMEFTCIAHSRDPTAGKSAGFGGVTEYPLVEARGKQSFHF